MSLISGTDLAKSYGPHDIFRGLSLAVPHAARIAIVGPNGVGKTTLLRLLAGVEEPSAGAVHRARSLRIGYLPQEASYATRSGVNQALELPLWEECLQAFADLRQQEAELRALEGAMADPERYEQALEKYGPLQARFEHAGGYTYETRIRQVLTGLGFEETDLQRPLRLLSGGQKTRALLARLLLEDPDLLILDEPTNHLDITSVEWLEHYLGEWGGTALIVSHDRYFLDRVATMVWEMSASALETYRGNYSGYLQQREDRWQRRQEAFEAEIERLQKEVEYVRRNISGQRTQQAKGRLRRLSRQLAAMEQGGVEVVIGKQWSEISDEFDISGRSMGVDEARRRLRALRAPVRPLARLNLRLHTALRSGDRVIQAEGLDVGYRDDGRVLFRSPDLLLLRGECAALIGPNGAGKTTFLRTLLGEIPPLGGKVKLGASLKVGYFAQAHEGLHPDLTVMEEITQAAGDMTRREAHDFLARFLFSGDDITNKPVGVLSGGERGRVALALLALQGANLLLLDEPTNHLDIGSQEILEAVLAEFPGTILLVTHDRYLIDRLATQIWEVLPDQASLRVFAGSYSEYMAEKEREKAGEAAERSPQMQGAGRATAGGNGRHRQTSTATERKRAARSAELEAVIAALEARLAELTRDLQAAGSDVARVHALGETYAGVEGELADRLAEWERLQLHTG